LATKKEHDALTTASWPSRRNPDDLTLAYKWVVGGVGTRSWVGKPMVRGAEV